MIMKLMIPCPECAAGYYGATTTDIAATCTKCPGNSWSTVDANAALTNCDGKSTLD